MELDGQSTVSSRKRPVKGLRRACLECKRRKLGGTPDADVSLPDRLPAVFPSEVEVNSPCPWHVGEKWGKLEQLFERFVCRKPSSIGANSTNSASVPRSPTLVGRDAEERQSEKEKHMYLPRLSGDAQSISSIGDDILAAHSTKWTSAPSIRTLVNSAENPRNLDSDPVRRALISLLPPQRDADIIFESTNGWMVLSKTYKPSEDIFVNKDYESWSLDMSAVAQEHPTVIARTLLTLAICIGTLPPDFNVSRLSNIWSLEATMENYVSNVTTLVTNSDEQMSTLPGLETLLLLALYHMDCANLRQAWLVIRRGLNLAHLMGFHRIIAQPTLYPSFEAVEGAQYIWRGFVDFDRYLGLHLRLPFASDDYPLPADATPELVHRCKLTSLSRRISELDRSITSQTYVATLALDEKLESLMKELTQSFWEVPNVPSTVRSPESAEVLERLVIQIWHFELKIFLHLPFLLRAPKEPRYSYSKVTALCASRNAIMRWFALRNAGITQACCRVAEMGVFIATVTIALDILIEMGTKEKSEVQKTRGNDFAMICRVISELEKLSRASPREKIAARSAVVIKKILSTLDPSRRAAGKARLTIPYFGTIEVEYQKPPVRPAFDIESDTGKKMNASVTEGTHLPVFSFVSNGLWPSMGADAGDGCAMDFDIVIFDGLEDRDMEGNWMF